MDGIENYRIDGIIGGPISAGLPTFCGIDKSIQNNCFQLHAFDNQPGFKQISGIHLDYGFKEAASISYFTNDRNNYKIRVSGGLDSTGEQPTGNVYELEMTENGFNNNHLEPLPNPIRKHCMVFARNMTMVIGGVSTNGDSVPDTWILDESNLNQGVRF